MIAQCKPTAVVGRGCRAILSRLAGPVAPFILEKLSGEDRQFLDQLLKERVEYVDDPVFRKRDVEQLVYGGNGRRSAAFVVGVVSPRPAAEGVSDAAPPMAPPLTAAQEVRLFQQFNLARYRIYRTMKDHRGGRLGLQSVRELLRWHHRALEARSQIVQANVALVLAMAKRTRLSGVDFAELVSEGNMALLRSLDKFDCSRGFKFSTYACRAMLAGFSRMASRTYQYRSRFTTEFDPSLEKDDFLDRKRAAVEGDCVEDLRMILQMNLADLSEIEQRVIQARFAMHDRPGSPKPFPMALGQVSAVIGVSKERVRQIQNRGLDKLRQALNNVVLNPQKFPRLSEATQAP